MNNKYIISIVICVVLVGSLVYFISRGETGTNIMKEDKQEAMTKNEQAKDEQTMKGDAMVKIIPPPGNPPTDSEPTPTPPPGNKIDEPKPVSPTPSKGSYKNYSADTVTNEQKAGNKIVLFFHAPWCPFCKEANTEFINRENEIPNGVTVLKTDYDSNTDLKKKYGVTYQHTFVQIDNDGNMVTKWNGGDIEEFKKNLK